MTSGVLPSQVLRAMQERGEIVLPQGADLVQPNSFDLPLGSTCWRLRSIRLPQKSETVQDVITELCIDTLDLTKGAILERNAVYIAELDCSVSLPADVKGECDSKSSTGRLDIQTRTLTDHSQQYDFVRAGYKGKLYLFISSNSFLIRVKKGISLNQMRLERGNPVVNDIDALALVASEELLYQDGQALTADAIDYRKGILLHLDLQHDVAGYRAKFTNTVVDLSRLDNPWEEFWERIPGGCKSITLEKNEFYILSTHEAIRIPHTHCAWIPPFRPEFGEFRSHYAGFLDSGFGYGNSELTGATITLEVRSHDNSLTLLHGTPVAPVLFMALTEKPDVIYGVSTPSNYQRGSKTQSGPVLAKYFC